MAKLPASLKRGMSLLDIHSHVGVDPLLYLSNSFPYCHSLRDAYEEAQRVGISHSVIFPWVTSFYYDLPALKNGKVKLARKIGNAPFEFENEQMLRQLYDIFPLYKNIFIPFAIIDTLRETRQQMGCLKKLLRKYPFYGLKVHPRGTQATTLTLAREGRVILDFARAENLPILIHTTCSPIDPLSQVSDVLKLARDNPKIRFCAAHFCGFHQKLFEEADRMDNVWVDSAAMSIGCDLVVQKSIMYESGPAKVPSDYRHPSKVFSELSRRFPNTFMWGSDNPAHTWVSSTKMGPGKIMRFELWGSMEREKELLKRVKGALYRKVAFENALAFIEG
jgi:predicted TIM-barrel fold metal-dependent hydrolase